MYTLHGNVHITLMAGHGCAGAWEGLIRNATMHSKLQSAPTEGAVFHPCPEKLFRQKTILSDFSTKTGEEGRNPYWKEKETMTWILTSLPLLPLPIYRSQTLVLCKLPKRSEWHSAEREGSLFNRLPTIHCRNFISVISCVSRRPLTGLAVLVHSQWAKQTDSIHNTLSPFSSSTFPSGAKMSPADPSPLPSIKGTMPHPESSLNEATLRINWSHHTLKSTELFHYYHRQRHISTALEWIIGWHEEQFIASLAGVASVELTKGESIDD